MFGLAKGSKGSRNNKDSPHTEALGDGRPLFSKAEAS
jgi:hypothetical protein